MPDETEMKKQIRIPPEVAALLSRLNTAGFAAYAVGGCVRDSLLGKQPKDWDLCTSARPEEIQTCFSSERTVLTGARYGTVTVISGETPYEITTFRAESAYSDCRHPDEIRFLDSLHGDLARRDFTVNAMAADVHGEVTDLFGGIQDLCDGVIRCVGCAEERFAEDALRIMRALRFSSEICFNIAPETAAAIHAQCGCLRSVAAERLRKELCGLLCGEHAAWVLDAFSDVICELIPEFAPCIGFRQYNPHHALDVWAHTLAALDASEPEETLRLAVLLHDIGKPSVFSMDRQLTGHFYGHAVVSAAMCEQILRRLRFDGETVRTVTALVRAHDDPLRPLSERRMRRMLSQFGESMTRTLLRLKRADRMGKNTEANGEIEAFTREAETLLEAVLARRLCFSLAQLKISGTDLLSMGVPQGKQIGAILQRLLQAVLAEEIPNEHGELMKYAQKMSRNSESN